MNQMKERKRFRKLRLISWILVTALIFTSVSPAAAAELTLENAADSAETAVETEPEDESLSLEGEDSEFGVPEEGEGPEEEKEEYGLYFYDTEGNQRYTDLTLTVWEGDTVQLPQVPEKEGWTALGWSHFTLDTVAEYEAGEEITVTKDMHLYAVYEDPNTAEPEEFTVRFFDENGEKEYEEYAVTVPEGTVVTVPSPEEREDVRAMGWSKTMNAKSAAYRVGKELTVTEDMDLYSVHQKLYTITFLTNTGLTTARLEKLTIQGVWKEKVTLPDLPVYSGYISDGWTNQAYKKTVTNKEGSEYTVVGNRTLYQINHKMKTYSIKFYNNDGTSSSSLNKLAKSVQEGEKVTLPSLPAKSGYDSLGWAASKNAAKAVYEEGESIKPAKDMKLYAVYKKITYCSVTYYNRSGAKKLSTLTQKVKKGTYINLPDLPAVVGYRPLGWSKQKNTNTTALLNENQRIYVSGDMKLYAFYKESASSIRFYTVGGTSEYTSIRMENAGTSAVMPSAFSPKGYTFLGWSTKKNQDSNPEYAVGQKYTNLKPGMKLYAVCKKKTDIEAENSGLTVEESQKYDEVFFIGDSRIYGMELALNGTYGGTPENVTYLCESGRSILWFQNNYKTGRNFYQTISETPGRKAVIWNLGINDLIDGLNDVSDSVEKYTETMTAMAQELQEFGCDFYFMSVNPVNENETASPNYGSSWPVRSAYSVRLFNWKVRENTSEYFSYIDTFSYLTNTGFILYDGLHYGDSTYLKIYDKAIETIDQS